MTKLEVAVACQLIANFCGRTDAYSPWLGDSWTAVRAEITPELVIDALRGAGPIGGYFLAADSHTHVGGLDFDTENGWDQGLSVGRAFLAAGIPAYVEASRRGCHLWIVAHERLPGIVWRRALRAVLQLSGIGPDPKIELRPGQDRLEDGQLGNALRLPMMPHQLTGIRNRLCDPETGAPIGRSLSEILIAVDLARESDIVALAERYQPPLDPNRIPKAYRRPSRDEESGLEASRLLLEMGVPNARPGRAVRCPFHDDKRPSLSILKDDERVVCHSPSCDAHNGGHGLGTIQLAALIRDRLGPSPRSSPAGAPAPSTSQPDPLTDAFA